MTEADAPIVALLTDFGWKDANVGVMKGVILGIAPEARLVDLSHEVGPQDIREAAWLLGRAAPYFSGGTIFVVVVDPGVGTARRGMAARLGAHLVVGPDNGVVTRLIERAEAGGGRVDFRALDRIQYWLPEPSRVFHGRDIFAPVAAHLARGVPLEEVGSAFNDPVRLDLPRPAATPIGLRGVVEYIDHFGNVRTNIARRDLAGRPAMRVRAGTETVTGLMETFGDRPSGALIAVIGSSGDLILAVVNGNAADRLGCRVGDEVDVIWD